MERSRVIAAAAAALVVGACSGPAAPHRTGPHGPAGPLVTDARFVLDGRVAAGAVLVTARSRLQVVFSAQVPPAVVTVTANGRPLPPDALAWSPDLLSADVPLAALLPNVPVEFGLAGPPLLAAPAPIQVTMLVTVPANSTTGVQPGFKPQTPMEIVIENSGPARPQSGLQDADMVYEYLSEYAITRMTAIYYARMPDQIGPVRSCRMINFYVTFAYSGLTMCSGASDGTLQWIWGLAPGSRNLPSLMAPADTGGHYFRVGFREAPHNEYTTGSLAQQVRAADPQAPGNYAVDPPHADIPAGQPADPPSVPLHGVTYAYDPQSAQYLRFDDGAAFADQDTGQQLHVKTVVLLHVPFHDAGWVEDDNGGAHSVWYDMLGSGPAEVYSDGQLVNATWHMGAPGQAYFDNHTPVWFTDQAGRVLALNTGLTWIHVLGVGQERCPTFVQACG